MNTHDDTIGVQLPLEAETSHLSNLQATNARQHLNEICVSIDILHKEQMSSSFLKID